MELSLGDLQQIELICVEASAWGLRDEVVDAAETLIKEGYMFVINSVKSVILYHISL